MSNITKMWMQREGYADVSETAQRLYERIGKRYYDRILSTSLDYACVYALYAGIERNSEAFRTAALTHTQCLVMEAERFFETVEKDDISNAMKLFERSDLEYMLHLFEEDEKTKKRLGGKDESKTTKTKKQ